MASSVSIKNDFYSKFKLFQLRLQFNTWNSNDRYTQKEFPCEYEELHKPKSIYILALTFGLDLWPESEG